MKIALVVPEKDVVTLRLWYKTTMTVGQITGKFVLHIIHTPGILVSKTARTIAKTEMAD
jgi:hypothetical protein